MCQVCVDYSQQKLNINEALHNLEETKVAIEEAHYKEVHEMLKRTLNSSYYKHNEEEYWEIYGFGD